MDFSSASRPHVHGGEDPNPRFAAQKRALGASRPISQSERGRPRSTFGQSLGLAISACRSCLGACRRHCQPQPPTLIDVPEGARPSRQGRGAWILSRAVIDSGSDGIVTSLVLSRSYPSSPAILSPTHIEVIKPMKVFFSFTVIPSQSRPPECWPGCERQVFET